MEPGPDVDSLRLVDRLDPLIAAWSPGARVRDVAPLLGGASSLTYRARLSGARDACIVVKLAPPGRQPVRNRDVLRQARVLRSLTRLADVRVPPVLFESPGDPPDVPPLFAMGFAAGDSFEPLLDEADPLPPAAYLEGRARMAARMLAALHAVPAAELGLAREPRVGLDEEVERWARLFETVDDDLRPRSRECADALRAAMPAPLGAAVVHGEYRLGNLLCAGAEVTAIIDWELWCCGDPRVDLAWLLQFADAASVPSAVRAAPPGLPGPDALLAEYEMRRGSAVPDVDWFCAHARFKQAAITAIHSKHNRRRPSPDPRQELRAKLIPTLMAQCLELLDAR